MTHHDRAPISAALARATRVAERNLRFFFPTTRVEVLIHVAAVDVDRTDDRETRIMLSVPGVGTALRARLPLLPHQPHALSMLLAGLSAWYGEPFCAVLDDAEAEDVLHHPERWAQLLGDLDGEQIRVEWIGHSRSSHERDRFLGAVGDFRRAKRLITFAATGQR